MNKPQAPQPQPIPLPRIPGVVMSNNAPAEPPMILVLGPEKSGKSALSSTLVGWQGKYPCVIAFDRTGPDTCSNIGLPVPVIKPSDEQGNSLMTKSRAMLDKLEQFCGKAGDKPFNALVVDCASTMIDKLMLDAMDEFIRSHEGRRPKDKRQIYNVVLDQGREIIGRLTSLGLPTIWLTWLQPPFVEETEDGPNGQKQKKTLLGGPMIDGQKLRALMAGKAHQICILEKIKGDPRQPDCNSDGFKRVLHTKQWQQIEAGGRYTSKLPEPCPAHLGYILDCIMRRA